MECVISASRTPAYASLCSNLNRRTARARPSAGSRGRPPWPLDWRITSGRCARCSCFACRHGPSQQGYEHATVVGSGTGRWPGGPRVSARPAVRALPGLRGPLGCLEGPLV